MDAPRGIKGSHCATGQLARIREQPPAVLDAIARSMNVRASEPAMQAICAKLIMKYVNPARLVGIDPPPVFV